MFEGRDGADDRGTALVLNVAIEDVGKCQAHRQIVRVGETVGPRPTSRLKRIKPYLCYGTNGTIFIAGSVAHSPDSNTIAGINRSYQDIQISNSTKP